MSITNQLLRKLPSVNELIEQAPVQAIIDKANRSTVVKQARVILDEVRQEVMQVRDDQKLPSITEIADRISNRVHQVETPSLRPVINATGILLHTNLGRAPMAKEAIDAMNEIACDYSSVELDLKTGKRSQRIAAIEDLLKELTGAEAAAVVNNNAGATMLTLAAVAAGGETIVSRGELIEIGGSFRLPDVMEVSGSKLKEVGTTNKTHLRDYKNAIGEETRAMMRVHTSNFRVMGFTQAPSLEELVILSGETGIPLIDDIGSGAMIDFGPLGFSDEPVASHSIKAGADIVLFSGDKLLGGPQAGIIVGKKKYIDLISKHPMMRALRVDKTTLAALAATLRLYREPEAAKESIPLLQLLSTSTANLQNRAERLAGQIAELPNIEEANPIEDECFLGGGSIPTQQMKTWCVAISPERISVDDLASQLRAGSPAVMGRIKNNQLYLDIKSVFPRQDRQLVEAVQACVS